MIFSAWFFFFFFFFFFFLVSWVPRRTPSFDTKRKIQTQWSKLHLSLMAGFDSAANNMGEKVFTRSICSGLSISIAGTSLWIAEATMRVERSTFSIGLMLSWMIVLMISCAKQCVEAITTWSSAQSIWREPERERASKRSKALLRSSAFEKQSVEEVTRCLVRLGQPLTLLTNFFFGKE